MLLLNIESSQIFLNLFISHLAALFCNSFTGDRYGNLSDKRNFSGILSFRPLLFICIETNLAKLKNPENLPFPESSVEIPTGNLNINQSSASRKR